MTDHSDADQCHLEMKLKQDVESPARHAPKPRAAGGEEAEVAVLFSGGRNSEVQPSPMRAYESQRDAGNDSAHITDLTCTSSSIETET